jgi:5'-3' exonuclease
LEQKEAAWKGEVLLPFFNMNRIREKLTKLMDKMTEEERERNKNNPVLIYQKINSKSIQIYG